MQPSPGDPQHGCTATQATPVPETQQGDLKAPSAPGGSQGVPLAPEGSQGVPLAPEGLRGVPLAPEGSRGVPPAPEGSQGVPLAPEGSQGVPLAPEGSQGDPALISVPLASGQSHGDSTLISAPCTIVSGRPQNYHQASISRSEPQGDPSVPSTSGGGDPSVPCTSGGGDPSVPSTSGEGDPTTRGPHGHCPLVPVYLLASEDQSAGREHSQKVDQLELARPVHRTDEVAWEGTHSSWGACGGQTAVKPMTTVTQQQACIISKRESPTKAGRSGKGRQKSPTGAVRRAEEAPLGASPGKATAQCGKKQRLSHKDGLEDSLKVETSTAASSVFSRKYSAEQLALMQSRVRSSLEQQGVVGGVMGCGTGLWV